MIQLRAMISLCLLGMSFVASAAAGVGGPIQITARQREALGIVVGKAQPRALVPRPRLPGRITLPNSGVRLITVKASAVLLAPLVAVGDPVTAGQELARLESPDFVSLQRDYLQALSQLDLARATADRERHLVKEGIIAGRRSVESTARLRGAQSRLEEQRQTLAVAGMTPSEIARLANTHHLNPTVVLRAKLAGVVLEQYAQAGERLAAGGALYRIGDLGALMVEVHTPLDIAQALGLGTRFSLPHESALGRVIAVGSEIHSLDQGVLVRGIIEDGATRLRPGQFVRVQFETARSEGAAFALPSTAVIHVHGRDWLLLQVEGGFEPIAVQIVGGTGRETVVVGPLREDSLFAFRGTAALKAHWLANPGAGQ